MKAMRTGPSILYLVLILGSVPILVPFLWMISCSLKTKDHLGDNPPVFVPINVHAYIRQEAILDEVVLLVKKANDRDKVRTKEGAIVEDARNAVLRSSTIKTQWSNYAKTLAPKRKSADDDFSRFLANPLIIAG